jgi:general secretion pathway protein D
VSLPHWFRGIPLAAGLLLWPVLALSQDAPPQQLPTPRFPVVPGMSPRPFTPRELQQMQQGNPANPANPATPAANPANPAAQPPRATTPAGPPTVYGGLSLNNASLTEVIDLLARQLKINYILDPRVKGGVILNTYGETKDIDTRSLLETILRINGFGMVKQGDLYRIVPLADISHLPVPPEGKTDSSSIPEDDRTMLNLVFLKYVTVDELAKVLDPFIGENARIYTYASANLLLILDSRRNMRRLMDLVAMFDSDQIANQRVHVFSVKNGRPSDISKELDNIVKSIALSEKNSPIKFLPIDRINTIIAVAPNPGVFTEVQTWLDKLDIPIKASAGGIKNYSYRVHYGEAQTIACSIQALYGQLNNNGAFGGPQSSITQCMQAANGNNGAGGVYGGGGFAGGGVNGGGMYGSGVFGGGGYGAGGYGAGGYGGGGYGGGGYGGGGYGGGGYGGGAAYGSPFGPAAAGAPNAASANGAANGDLTGTYLGNAPIGPVRGPRVIANPLNNTLLIQATAQEYESIEQLVKELDVPPRQVLIEAKIYSIDLSYNFSSSVTAALQALSGTASSGGTTGTTGTGGTGATSTTGTGSSSSGISAISTTAASLMSGLAGGGIGLSASMLVGKSRALQGVVSLMESESKAKVISSPAIIATDSIPATITVGTTVPTEAGSTASGITGAVTTAVSNVSTGIGLSITARVTPSGIVTMIINQSVSDPEATNSSYTSISSPSFATKSISTQVTVQDGDTIAIGGQIQESTTSALSGIPLLDRIPVVGALFGSRTYTKERTELIMFITPHVIFDSNQMIDASDELKDQIKLLRKDVRE